MGVLDRAVEAWQFVVAVPFSSLMGFLWLTVFVELPRYFLGMQATAAALLFREKWQTRPLETSANISLLLVGHNEADSIEKCIRSLHEQTFKQFEIVCVDDGSTDATFSIMCRLQREGLVQSVAQLQLRGGKSAGINFASRLASSNIFVVLDCDCSFEPNAIEELVRPLICNPNVAAVSGNILVRNYNVSVTASLQAIEYLNSISLGRAYSDILDQVSCVSGAYGAFRRDAWESIYGMDSGGGEDLDFTIRLRLAGYKVVFARHSICYTDVPATPYALLRQRTRWERDAFWIRLRKYKRIMNPFSVGFSWRDALHQWDFLLLSVAPAVVFPFYLAWLVTRYFDAALVILFSVALVLFVFDIVTFICAVLVTGKRVYWRLILFLPIYGVFQSYVMKLHRFYAYTTEWIWSSSRSDNYVPKNVSAWSNWR